MKKYDKTLIARLGPCEGMKTFKSSTYLTIRKHRTHD